MATALSTKARHAAWVRLAEAHADEFATLLAEERVARGLPAEPTIGRHGRVAVERTPAPALCRIVATSKVVEPLGITPPVWRTWLRLGIPVGREADVAAALGLPLKVLWPPLKAEEPKPKRAKAEPANPWHCDRCSDRFFSRADLARHRLHTGHGHDEGVA